jgi:HK97 family phage major capsid protein
MNKAQELADKLAAKTRELQEFMGDVSTKSFTSDDLVEIKKRNEELNRIEDERVEAQSVLDIATKNNDRMNFLNTPVNNIGFGDGSRPTNDNQKSLGELFAQNAGYREAKGAFRGTVEMPGFDYGAFMQQKTNFLTSAGWAPANPRTNIVIPSGQRRPVVADLIPQDPTVLSSIKYMEETTFTNNAAVVAEAGTKPESALAFTERTSPVVKIANSLPISEEQLEDVPQAQAFINSRLGLMLQLAEEVELLTGDGTGSHLDGFLHRSGTQTQAKGGDPTPTAVYKAMTDIRAGGSTPGFAEPDGIVIHPNDWVDVATLQDGLGRYVWGNPYDVQIERLWGKPLIITPAETENTILVGDFGMYSHISRRTGVTLRIYDQHSDFAVKNLVLAVIEERLSLEIYRPAAFCKVTGV